MLKWDYDSSDLSTVESFNVYRVAVMNGKRSEVLIGEVKKDRPNNNISSKTDNSDGTVTYSFIDSGQNLSNPDLRIELQPSTEYSYCLEAVRDNNNPPPYSMPTETINAYTHSESEKLDIQLKGVTGNKLTVYPDREYKIEANVSNKQNFISLTYQWQKKDSRNNWNDIFNATTEKLSFMQPKADTSGEYRCRIDAFTYNKELHQQTGITVFTDEITVSFKMREVKMETFTVTNQNGSPEAVVTLCPKLATCFVTPTGNVTFIIKSASGEKRFSVPLKDNGTKATAKLSESADFSALEDGIYQVSVFYGGDDAFGSFTSDITKSLLIGDSAIYPVLFNEKGERTDTFYYGNTMYVRFFRYTMNENGTTTETEIADEAHPEGYSVSVSDEPNIYQKKLTVKLAGETEKEYVYKYIVKKRPLEVRVTAPELFTGNVENYLPQAEVIFGTSLAEGDSLDDIVQLTFMNSTKTKTINIDNKTAPGTYYAMLSPTDHNKATCYDLKLHSSLFNINATRFSVSVKAEKLNEKEAGTVKMILPETRSGVRDSTYRFESGTAVKLTAVPNPGFKFDHWKIEGLSDSTETSIHDEYYLNVPRTDVKITAFFKSYNGMTPALYRAERL